MRWFKAEDEIEDDLVEEIKALKRRIIVLEASIEMLKEANLKSKLPIA